MPIDLRCAPYTESLGADPIGTAGEYHDVIVADLPLPWPREILDHELLVGVAAVVKRAAEIGRRVRVLGAVPPVNTAEQLVVRRWYRPTDGPVMQFVGRETKVERHLVGTMVAEAALGEFDGDPIEVRHLLVCTHGQRDRCCGAFGTRLHGYLADSTTAARVLRISHTGGHRYAPTAISFPEGRAWGFLADSVADQIADRSGPPSTLHRHDRGSLTMPSAAQVVDSALFAQHGWNWLDIRREGRVVEAENGRTVAEVEWRDADGIRTVARGVVTLHREIPSIDCGVALDENKTFPEWGLESLIVERDA